MTCEQFISLNPVEKIDFIGKLVHLVQSNEYYFIIAQSMIKEGEGKGLFNNIKILPNDTERENSNELMY